MKLRIAEGSLRLRLEQPDLDELVGQGAVVKSIAVAPNSSLVYTLELELAAPNAEASAIDLQMHEEGGDVEISVLVPRNLAIAWARDGEKVGLENRVWFEGRDGAERSLRILIEKDLGCSH